MQIKDKMEENQNLKTQIKNNKNIILSIIGFSVIMIMAGMFYVGAAYSCNQSNGELSGGLNLLKLKCINIDIIGVCEFENQLFIPPNETSFIPPLPGG